jgi:hypothetical protein
VLCGRHFSYTIPALPPLNLNEKGANNMLILGRPKSINMVNESLTAYQPPNRDRANICVIDNEEFPYLERLRRNNFKIVHLKDIENVSSVSEYDIVLVDIHGVATGLSENFQGAFLIKEIRSRYPSKIVIAYSAQSFNASYNEYFRHADFMLVKDITSESWVENLDHAIKLCVNPEYQWKKLRDYLLEKSVPLSTVLRLEDDFVRSIHEKRRQFPKRSHLALLSQDLRAVLQSFAGSLLFKLLLG